MRCKVDNSVHPLNQYPGDSLVCSAGTTTIHWKAIHYVESVLYPYKNYSQDSQGWTALVYPYFLACLRPIHGCQPVPGIVRLVEERKKKEYVRAIAIFCTAPN